MLQLEVFEELLAMSIPRDEPNEYMNAVSEREALASRKKLIEHHKSKKNEQAYCQEILFQISLNYLNGFHVHFFGSFYLFQFLFNQSLIKQPLFFTHLFPIYFPINFQLLFV